MDKKERRVILSIVSLFVFILLSILVILKKTFVDGFISNSIINFWNPTTNGFFIFMGNYSQEIMIGIAILITILLYSQKRKRQSLIFVSTLVISYILKEILKLTIQRGRPAIQMVQETGYSFPSGHSIFSMILFSFLIYFYKDEMKNKAGKEIFISLNIFLILLVGFSRIYINVHWFTDVIGGYAIGFFLFNMGVLFLKNKTIK